MSYSPEKRAARDRVFEIYLDEPDITQAEISQRLAAEGLVNSNGNPYALSEISRIKQSLGRKLDRARARHKLKLAGIDGDKIRAAEELQLLVDELREKMDTADDNGDLKLWRDLQQELRKCLAELAKITGEGEVNTQTHRYEAFDAAETTEKLKSLGFLGSKN
jgi:hypothetical protein